MKLFLLLFITTICPVTATTFANNESTSASCLEVSYASDSQIQIYSDTTEDFGDNTFIYKEF